MEDRIREEAQSAFARREDKECALGFDARVGKPVEPGERARAVASLVDGAGIERGLKARA